MYNALNDKKDLKKIKNAGILMGHYGILKRYEEVSNKKLSQNELVEAFKKYICEKNVKGVLDLELEIFFENIYL